MYDKQQPYEQDMDWFVTACRQDNLPKPCETMQEIFADKVAIKLCNCVYPENPTFKARSEAYEEFRSGKWGVRVV